MCSGSNQLSNWRSRKICICFQIKFPATGRFICSTWYRSRLFWRSFHLGIIQLMQEWDLDTLILVPILCCWCSPHKFGVWIYDHGSFWEEEDRIRLFPKSGTFINAPSFFMLWTLTCNSDGSPGTVNFLEHPLRVSNLVNFRTQA